LILCLKKLSFAFFAPSWKSDAGVFTTAKHFSLPIIWQQSEKALYLKSTAARSRIHPTPTYT